MHFATKTINIYTCSVIFNINNWLWQGRNITTHEPLISILNRGVRTLPIYFSTIPCRASFNCLILFQIHYIIDINSRNYSYNSVFANTRMRLDAMASIYNVNLPSKCKIQPATNFGSRHRHFLLLPIADKEGAPRTCGNYNVGHRMGTQRKSPKILSKGL